MAHVADLEGYEVASAQLAVDAKLEEREIADSTYHLKADAQRPDVLDLKGGLLSNDLSLVPGLVMNGMA